MRAPWLRHIEELVTSTLTLAASRSGRIAALTVAVPGGLPHEDLAVALRARLADCGLPDLDIRTAVTAGALRITSVEFER